MQKVTAYMTVYLSIKKLINKECVFIPVYFFVIQI